MKRWSIVIVTLLTSTLFIHTAWSQTVAKDFYSQSYESRNSGSFSADHSILSAGLGFVDHNGINNIPFLGPLYIQYEHGILDEFGIAGFGSLSFSSRSFNQHSYNQYTQYRNVLAIGAMGYYHFNKLIPVKELDVYAGMGLGIKFITDRKVYANSPTQVNPHSSLILAARAGARWYFNPNFAAFAESGYNGLSYLTLGVTYKF